LLPSTGLSREIEERSDGERERKEKAREEIRGFLEEYVVFTKLLR
jgi:hypothetical protein